MEIFIPSLGREPIVTYDSISPEWLPRTFVVAESQVPGRRTLRTSVRGIARVRQDVVDRATVPFVFFLDDDLRFFHRKPGSKKLHRSGPAEVGAMLVQMRDWLEDGIPCVGLTARYGNNWLPGDVFVENHRPCMAYGFDRRILQKHNIRFDDVDVCEDYHVILSLLRHGYPNRMSVIYACEDNGVNATGGCSTYRTKEMVATNMGKFKELHDPYVSLRPTRGLTQGFDIGQEVRVQWKKAFKERDLWCGN